MARKKTGEWKNFLDPFKGHKHFKTAEKQLKLYQKESPNRRYQILKVTTTTTITINKEIMNAIS